MRLGFPTEDNNKKPKPTDDSHEPPRLGFPNSPQPLSPPQPKPKNQKIILHSRYGFPTTPNRTRVQKPIEPIIHRKESVKGDDLVSIMVLNYNTLEVLKLCIRSVLAKTVHPYELMVIDNGSTDGSVEWAKKVKQIHVVIENGRNLGFSKANNFGMRVASGDYYLLLNSDTLVLTKRWLDTMVTCASDPLVGTVGAKLLYETGEIQHIGGGIHPTTLDPYHPYDRQPADIPESKRNHTVPFATGACLLIKKSTVQKIGYLDEFFEFGFEDVDYGLRVVQAGLKNVVCCDAVLTHLWAYTQRKFRGSAKLVGKNVDRYRQKWLSELKKIPASTSFWNWGPYVPPYSLKSVPLTVPKD